MTVIAICTAATLIVFELMSIRKTLDGIKDELWKMRNDKKE